MGHHPYGAGRLERLTQTDLFLGSEPDETESAFVAAVKRRAADRRPSRINAKNRRGNRRLLRRLVAFATVLLVIAAVVAAALAVWPRLSDREFASESAVVAPAAAQGGSASETLAGATAVADQEAAAAPDSDTGSPASSSAGDDSASATGSLSATQMAGTVSDDSSAGAAIDDGLPPLPGVKPDPG